VWRESEAMRDDARRLGLNGIGAVSYPGLSAADELICQGISWSILLMG
jgi:hypothetical protein